MPPDMMMPYPHLSQETSEKINKNQISYKKCSSEVGLSKGIDVNAPIFTPKITRGKIHSEKEVKENIPEKKETEHDMNEQKFINAEEKLDIDSKIENQMIVESKPTEQANLTETTNNGKSALNNLLNSKTGSIITKSIPNLGQSAISITQNKISNEENKRELGEKNIKTKSTKPFATTERITSTKLNEPNSIPHENYLKEETTFHEENKEEEFKLSKPKEENWVIDKKYFSVYDKKNKFVKLIFDIDFLMSFKDVSSFLILVENFQRNIIN